MRRAGLSASAELLVPIGICDNPIACIHAFQRRR